MSDQQRAILTGRDVDLRIWDVQPVHHHAVGDWNERRALLYTVGTALVDFADLGIKTTSRSYSDLLRAIRSKSDVSCQPRLWRSLRVDAEHPRDRGRSTGPLQPEEDPQWLKRIESAAQGVVSAIHAIREKGGAVCLPEQPLLTHMERAAYDFPDDMVIEAAQRQGAYLRLKDAGTMPSPPDTVMRIIGLASDDESDLQQLANAVALDPAITAKVMQYVNSPVVGLRTTIASIDRAVVHLGRSALSSLALAFSLVSSHRRGACEAFDYESFWSEAVVRAVAARHIIGRKRGGIRADEAFTAGLLCQIGRLALATSMPSAYAAVLRHAAHDPSVDLGTLERTAFGIDHAQLAGEMLTDWNMPEYFCRAILRQDCPDHNDTLPPGSPVRVLCETLNWTEAVWAIVSCTQAPIDREALMTALDGAAQLGIPEESFGNEFDAIVDQWGQMGQVLDVHTKTVPSWCDMGAPVPV